MTDSTKVLSDLEAAMSEITDDALLAPLQAAATLIRDHITDPKFKFALRYVYARDDPYFAVRWDRAREMTITARTKQEAIKLASGLLGPAPDHHHWAFTVDKIEQVSP